MRLKLKLIPLKIIICIAFFISCTDNLNFDNINLDIEPEYTSPLVFFKLDQRDFLDENNQEISVVSDITDFRVLDNAVLKENLVELAIDFEIENGFNRSFLVDFILFSKSSLFIY